MKLPREPGPGRGTLVREDAIWATTLFALAIAVAWSFRTGGSHRSTPGATWPAGAQPSRRTGFTLFDGQPYLWYGPTWYCLAPHSPPRFRIEWFAGLISAASRPRRFPLHAPPDAAGEPVAPIVAGTLFGAAGPVVAYTCHYGAEGLALFMTLLALLFAPVTRRAVGSFLGGLVFGVALVSRLNFVFDSFLFLPWMRRPSSGRRAAASGPPSRCANWWRNH